MKNTVFFLLLFTGFLQAQIVTIPDANFKAKLLAADTTVGIAVQNSSFVKIDTNSDGEIQYSEALNINSLFVDGSNISTLVGIEAFLNLTNLNCSNNSIATLDLSANNALTTLTCYSNQLNNIIYPTTNQIELFNCGRNQLSTIDLTNFANLTELRCQNNLLTSLTVSQNNLTTLYCDKNQISVLNINSAPVLNYLDCNNNALTNLNLSNVTATLTHLGCSVNQLTTLNTNDLINLTFLDCSQNQLSNLNFSPITNLAFLQCFSNQLTMLQIDNLPHLENLWCENNLFTTLDPTKFANVRSLSFGNPGLNPVDISAITTLFDVAFYGGLQTNLDVSTLSGLIQFYCRSSQITDLDLTHNPLLCNLSLLDNTNLISLKMKNARLRASGCGFSVTNSPNLLYICANEGDFSNIQNALLNFGGTTNPAVEVNSYCSFTPGGDYNTITGTVLYDCDLNDLTDPYIKMNINDGTNTGSTFTNSQGNYTFYTQAGNFDVAPDLENPSWFIISPPTANINFPLLNNTTQTQDFCVNPNGVHPDLEVIFVPLNNARPGFDSYYKIIYKNKGNQIQSGMVTLDFNTDIFDYQSSTPAFFQFVPGQMRWNYSNLRPLETRQILLTLQVHSPPEKQCRGPTLLYGNSQSNLGR